MEGTEKHKQLVYTNHNVVHTSEVVPPPEVLRFLLNQENLCQIWFRVGKTLLICALCHDLCTLTCS